MEKTETVLAYGNAVNDPPTGCPADADADTAFSASRIPNKLSIRLAHAHLKLAPQSEPNIILSKDTQPNLAQPTKSKPTLQKNTPNLPHANPVQPTQI